VHVAAFITSHGFGHAGRASAVLDALHARVPGLTADVFTRVESAFLDSSLRAPHRKVEIASDVGTVLRGPFESDLEATARAVRAWLDGLEAAAERVAARLSASRAVLALCDIDALGILAAARAGIPSVLVENFRWDWLYRALPLAPRALHVAADRLASIYRLATLHLQVPPACDHVDRAVQIALPVARAPRTGRDEARARLGLTREERVVLVTLGGAPGEQTPLDPLRGRPDVTFLATGSDRAERVQNVVRLARGRPLYLPDLVRASDAVVGKLGYSTLAETWRQGRPLLRVTRREWPESAALSAWAEQHVPGSEIDDVSFRSGDWLARVDELLALPPGEEHARAGQDEVAERILPLLG
jgi:hypothetical protein